MFKHLALCYHFNKHIALVLCLAASVGAAILHVSRGGSSLLPLSTMPSMCPGDAPRRKGLDVSLAGFAALLLGLFYGHKMPFVRPQKLFVDKICIHQTDMRKKAAGIRALDEFLHCSRQMVVLFSTTCESRAAPSNPTCRPFPSATCKPGPRSSRDRIPSCATDLSRLWCVYELAAYAAFGLDDDAGSNLIFLPQAKLPSMLTICAALWAWPSAEYMAQLLNGGGTRDDGGFLATTVAPVPIAPIVLPALFGFIGWSVLVVGRQRAQLLAELRSFSVRRAECCLEADRAFVEGAIARWYSGDLHAVQAARGEGGAGEGGEGGAGSGGEGGAGSGGEGGSDGLGRFEAQLQSGRVYCSVERLVFRHRCGLSLADRCFVVVPVVLTGFDYALVNPPGSSMALTFILIMAPFFILSMHLLSLVLPPLFVLLRRAGLAGSLALALLLPLGSSVGMCLLNGVFMLALQPQCARLGTFL